MENRSEYYTTHKEGKKRKDGGLQNGEKNPRLQTGRTNREKKLGCDQIGQGRCVLVTDGAFLTLKKRQSTIPRHLTQGNKEKENGGRLQSRQRTNEGENRTWKDSDKENFYIGQKNTINREKRKPMEVAKEERSSQIKRRGRIQLLDGRNPVFS